MMDARRLIAACAATAALLAGGHATAAAAPLPDDQELAAPFEAWMARVFAVPDTPDIDEPLRKEMGAIAAAHLARLHVLLPAWIAKERARSGPAVQRADLDRQTDNRLVNEIALWRLESPGPDYDAAWRRAILSPVACLPARDSYLGLIMTVLQAAPPADRAVLLEGERVLLARWGQPRTALPPLPAVSLADDERAGIARLAAGDEKPDTPMVPVVASVVFANPPGTPDDTTRCVLHQWGLHRALRRGDAPDAALAAWRYATMRTARDWTREPAANTPEGREMAATGYPFAAREHLVQGEVQVLVTADAQGRYVSGRIERRDLKVPGIVDARPVAFETLLDEATLAQAARNFKPEPAGSAPPSITISWRLQ